ncbi:MAG: hypothetical protein IPJ12_03155 [Betaproteobacteria bacterium]|nr:hypothetical protein [Betaproteobacteria bacterium]
MSFIDVPLGVVVNGAWQKRHKPTSATGFATTDPTPYGQAMSPRSTGKKAKNSKPLCPLDESIAISPISDTGWDVLLIGAARLFA